MITSKIGCCDLKGVREEFYLPRKFSKRLLPYDGFISTYTDRSGGEGEVFIILIFFIVVNYSCPNFPPLLSPALPTPTFHIQHCPPPPLSLSMGSLYMFLDLTFPLLSLFSPSPVLSGHCQFVLNFYVSGSILLTCWFCWLGSTDRWDHGICLSLPGLFHLA